MITEKEFALLSNELTKQLKASYPNLDLDEQFMDQLLFAAIEEAQIDTDVTINDVDGRY
jgi:hypothetical protein